MLVKLERPLIGFLCVDRHRTTTPSREPFESVCDQKGANAQSSCVWVYREALEEARTRSLAHDGIPYDSWILVVSTSIERDSVSCSRRREDCFVDSCAIELPEWLEAQPVDNEDLPEIHGVTPSEMDPKRRR